MNCSIQICFGQWVRIVSLFLPTSSCIHTKRIVYSLCSQRKKTVSISVQSDLQIHWWCIVHKHPRIRQISEPDVSCWTWDQGHHSEYNFCLLPRWTKRDTSRNAWNRHWWSLWSISVSYSAICSLPLKNVKWHSDPWPTVTSQLIRLSTNFMTLIPSLTFTDLWVVSMEHLQRVLHASRERLPFRTPGSVAHFGTCLCFNCWDQMSRACRVFTRFFTLNTPRYFLDFA